MDRGSGAQEPRLHVAKRRSSTPDPTLISGVTSLNNGLSLFETSLSSSWVSRETALPQRVAGMLKPAKARQLGYCIWDLRWILDHSSQHGLAPSQRGPAPSQCGPAPHGIPSPLGRQWPCTRVFWANAPRGFNFPPLSVFLTLHHLSGKEPLTAWALSKLKASGCHKRPKVVTVTTSSDTLVITVVHLALLRPPGGFRQPRVHVWAALLIRPACESTFPLLFSP